MRAAVLLLAAFLSPGTGVLADDTAPDTLHWGCASAAYMEPLDIPGYDGPAFRSLYTTYYVDGAGGDIEEAIVPVADGGAYLGAAPYCGRFDDDGAPDPLVVRFSPGHGTEIVAIVRGRDHIIIAAHPDAADLAPVAITSLSGRPGQAVAYLETARDMSVLHIVQVNAGEVQDRLSLEGFADPTGRDPRVVDFVRDCGDGPELVLPSTNWTTLDKIRLIPDGLERATIARKPDFSRLVRALECHTE